MTLELINPEGLSSPLSYTHVVAATGSPLVFVAGQVADDADGNLVGHDDLAAQARQAFANVGRAVAAVDDQLGSDRRRPCDARGGRGSGSA